jgi:menaquinone-specific isochorismate synthase
MEDLLRTVAAKVSAARSEIAATKVGRLVSLSLSLSADQFGSVVADGAECQWLSPEGSLHGGGEVVRLDGDLARDFREVGGRWVSRGDGLHRPVALFTYPPPNSPDRPSLWVPKAVIRRSAGAFSVILSWRRDDADIGTIMGEWMELLRSMLMPVVETERAGTILALSAQPDSRQWEKRVRATSRAIANRRFDKVVLARRFQITLAAPPAVAALVGRLAAANPRCHTFTLPHRQGRVVASTPEVLAAKRGHQVVAHALAGTARRHEAEAENQAAVARLLSSAKERREHDLVAAVIASHMRLLCETVHLPPEPTIMALPFVQHLWTPIIGRLRANYGLLDMVERLHPTPAVLGTPREAAALWLDRIGERRDGLYSGVAGWIDSGGDGDAVVVLRSAFVEDCRAILWAGAGIMADSLPEAEFAETELKMATMLEALRS